MINRPMKGENDVEMVALQLKRIVRREGFTLTALSSGPLGKAPDWLSKAIRGQRTFRLEDLFAVLAAVDVSPADFFAELYDLYRLDELGAEFAPGIFEAPIRRFVETVARRAASAELETEGERLRRAGSTRRRPARPRRGEMLSTSTERTTGGDVNDDRET